MKQISKKLRESMRVKPPGRASYARIVIFNMKVGDIILLEPKDWNQERSPSQLISRIEKGTGRKYTCVDSLDDPGWLIERIK